MIPGIDQLSSICAQKGPSPRISVMIKYKWTVVDCASTLSNGLWLRTSIDSIDTEVAQQLPWVTRLIIHSAMICFGLLSFANVLPTVDDMVFHQWYQENEWPDGSSSKPGAWSYNPRRAHAMLHIELKSVCDILVPVSLSLTHSWFVRNCTNPMAVLMACSSYVTYCTHRDLRDL